MTDRETRLREIRERTEYAASHGGPFESASDRDLILEDVPWLLAEVDRLRDELDGVKCELELRKTLRVQPEESEHIARTSDLLIRTLTENDELRAEIERLSDGELLRISKQLETGTSAFDYPGSAVDG